MTDTEYHEVDFNELAKDIAEMFKKYKVYPVDGLCLYRMERSFNYEMFLDRDECSLALEVEERAKSSPDRIPLT
jgi:hypothetical protein